VKSIKLKDKLRIPIPKNLLFKEDWFPIKELNLKKQSL
jgi:hypothetical protein